MKNVINHYYNLFPNEISRTNNSYFFNINEKEFCLVLYEETIDNIDDLVILSNELYNIDNNFMNIIFTTDKKPYVKFDEEIYILLKINCNLDINIKSVCNFLLLNNYYKEDTKNIDWNILWSNKVDEVENTIIEYFDEFPLIAGSVNYYIGMAENAISYFANIVVKNKNIISLNHKRLRNDIIFNFYNPLNIILDYRAREISEYIKYCFFNNNINLFEIFNNIKKLNLNIDEYKMIYARLLYPSYYFDAIEKIINDEEKEVVLEKIISKINQYEILLKEIIVYINEIYYIESAQWIE